MLRLPVLLLLISATSSLSWAEESPVAPTTGAVVPAVPAEQNAVPLDEPGRLAEPEIPKSEPPELAAEEFSIGWTLFRTLVVLAMVVALAYLTLNVGLRKLLGIRSPVGTQMVTVLERVALDQKRSLFVVEAGGEVLLLGGGDSALTLITKLDRTELDRQRAAAPDSPVQLSPFLRKLLGRKEAPSPAAAPPPPVPDLDRNP